MELVYYYRVDLYICKERSYLISHIIRPVSYKIQSYCRWARSQSSVRNCNELTSLYRLLRIPSINCVDGDAPSFFYMSRHQFISNQKSLYYTWQYKINHSVHYCCSRYGSVKYTFIQSFVRKEQFSSSLITVLCSL